MIALASVLLCQLALPEIPGPRTDYLTDALGSVVGTADASASLEQHRWIYLDLFCRLRLDGGGLSRGWTAEQREIVADLPSI